MNALRTISLFTVFALALAACAPAVTPTPAPTAIPTQPPLPTATPEPPKTILDIAAGDPRFSTLSAAVQAAELTETLKSEGPFTVFAPTDDAFAKLPAGTLDELLKPENKQQLIDILLYHVVPGKISASDVVKVSNATTALGQDITVKVDMGNVYINDAKVILTDIIASNGIIHVIDTVILPPTPQADIVDTAIADGRFKTLVAALQAAELVETLKAPGTFTVFAPTDEAFAKLPPGTLDELLKPENKQKLANILLYHVLPSKVMAEKVVKLTDARTALGQDVTFKVDMDKVYINDAQIVITDIETSNGVIHVIDTVILPKPDLVDTAIADGRFTKLVTALQAAELVETLKGDGPFTVFAPTDEAFEKLPAGTLESLLNPENKQKLSDILLYHVVPGKVTAEKVVKLSSADTALGKAITIKVMDGTVYINDAKVVITDIQTANGVIHVIDAVLLPPQ